MCLQVGDPLTEGEAEELVRESDLNGDGKINYVEFVAMTTRPWREENATMATKLLQSYS